MVARVLLGTALLAFLAMEAAARPGGGNSYSGGSSSRSSGSSRSSSSSRSSYSSSSRGSSSSGSSTSENANALFSLIVFGFVIWAWVRLSRFAEAQNLWFHFTEAQRLRLDSGGSSQGAPASERRDAVLDLVLKHDPDFSLVLFEDFAYTLYAESQRARHDPAALARLAPYWTSSERDALAARAPAGGRVLGVVVGSLAPLGAFENPGRINVQFSFETNLNIQIDGEPATPNGLVSSLLVKSGLTARAETARAITQYVRETWTFVRDPKVTTRPWTGVRKLGCPSCGAPLSSADSGRCESCGQASGAGRFDWQVISVSVYKVEERPHSLTGTTEEVGTDAPTRFTPAVREKLDALLRDDPGLSQASIEARLRLIFNTMQSAWSAQDLRPLRAFVSDRQYDYLQYWIEAYQEQGLRNLMTGPRFDKFVFARVGRDAHYDALTVRIWASGCDYTIETKTGRVVGGSRTVPRRYSEYWTLIRSAKARGTPRVDRNCPGCGASLQVNMAGECEHCTSHLTSGEFDWVLSKIEQDESYEG